MGEVEQHIDVEAKTRHAIVLKQKPIITYDLIEQIGKDVEAEIKGLKLSTIDATENNLRLLKTTRTDLKKQFEIFENQRKMVKDLIMKPYNDFDNKYKECISNLFKDADLQLKDKVGVVDDGILALKVNVIKEYFESFKVISTFDFVSFEDLNLKIIKSRADKSIKDEIDVYMGLVESNINTIKTLENSDRILAKYQASKDLNNAISQTNIEIQREKENEEKKVKQQRFKAEAQTKQEEFKAEQQAQIQEDREEFQNATGEAPKEPIEQPQVFQTTFKVVATLAQLQLLKKFMQDEGISYESK